MELLLALLQSLPSLLPFFSWQKVGDCRDAFSSPFGDGTDSPPPLVIPAAITPLVMADAQFGFTTDTAVGYIVWHVIISLSS